MEKNKVSYLDQVLKYLERGLSIIPLKEKDKKPFIEWQEYQKRRPTKEEVESWFLKWPDANIGIVTGEISGIAVIDFDSSEAFGEAQIKGPSSPTVKTGRGYHVYYRYLNGIRNFQKRSNLPGIDLRGDGGYVVAPPSIHPNGNVYEWVKGSTLDDLTLAPLPEWLIIKDGSEKIPLKELYKGVAEGERNNTLARLVGSWVRDGLSLEECVENARLWNRKNTPPLPDEEVVQTTQSIYETHHRKENNINNDIVVSFPLSLPEFLKQDIPPVEYHAKGILQKQGKTMLSAQTNVGKSIFAQNLAIAMTAGQTKFLNRFEVVQARVLYLDLEMGEAPLKERFQTMTAKDGLVANNLFVKHLSNFDLTETACQNSLEEWLAALKIEVLILDPIGSAWAGDENNKQEVGKLTGYLNSLIDRHQISIFVVHHWRKTTRDFKKGGEMAAGSYKWAAWLDHHITLEGTPKSLTVSCQKSRHSARFEPFLVKLNTEILWFEFLTDYEKKFKEEDLVKLFDTFQVDRVAIPELLKRAKERNMGSKDTVRKLIKASKEFCVDAAHKTHYLFRRQF